MTLPRLYSWCVYLSERKSKNKNKNKNKNRTFVLFIGIRCNFLTNKYNMHDSHFYIMIALILLVLLSMSRTEGFYVKKGMSMGNSSVKNAQSLPGCDLYGYCPW